MASGRSKKKKPANLSPTVLASGVVVLVSLGIAGGLALDLFMHPASPPPMRKAATTPARPPPRPRIQLPSEGPDVPSILSNHADVSNHPDLRAEPRTAEQAAPVPPVRPAPMTAFAMPSTAAATRPGLAIVIDDTGLDHAHALQAIALPAAVTISFMTYATDLPELVRQAREAGHEAMAHVPMEPLDHKQNPGPHALTVAMDDAAIRAALSADLDGWQGYVGVNNHMGSRFTADPARMAVVMEELKARGLLWLDSKTTANSAGPAAARATGVPEIERDVFLDNVQTFAAISDEIEHAIAAAKSHGTAIAIGHPHDATIAALKQLLPTLPGRGVELVPITEVLKRREAVHRPS